MSDSVFCEKFRDFVGADDFFHFGTEGQLGSGLVEVSLSQRLSN